MSDHPSTAEEPRTEAGRAFVDAAFGRRAHPDGQGVTMTEAMMVRRIRDIEREARAATIRELDARYAERTEQAVREAADTLDAAWKAVEAELPEGWRIERLDMGVWGSWWAYAGRGPDRVHGEGPTPTAALLALRDRLVAQKESAR